MSGVILIQTRIRKRGQCRFASVTPRFPAHAGEYRNDASEKHA